ncbi:hypothetical protein ACN38_g11410 [Penicillium nordicum]|uniref:Uncharacterized protein n=1 Tax=Penicillium nordicum TaxID=229535 RepID=A0A0M8NR94_9EURO|nr:hypothetical protein ACN38_g11410 [Penicillium nordicum]
MLYVVCDLQGGILVCIFAFLAYIISILGFWFVYICAVLYFLIVLCSNVLFIQGMTFMCIAFAELLLRAGTGWYLNASLSTQVSVEQSLMLASMLFATD